MREHDEKPTAAERAVLRAIAKRGTLNGAAEEICISPHTVRAHLAHLYNKTGVHNKTQLIARRCERGGWKKSQR
jgi:DNA-binding NarL/FixJ family response regulator